MYNIKISRALEIETRCQVALSLTEIKECQTTNTPKINRCEWLSAELRYVHSRERGFA